MESLTVKLVLFLTSLTLQKNLCGRSEVVPSLIVIIVITHMLHMTCTMKLSRTEIMCKLGACDSF